jgi:hypothetical protein
MPHLALGDQLGHRTDGLPDRDVELATMQVVQVNDVDPEPAQRGLARGAHVVAVTAGGGGVRHPDLAGDAELRRDLDLLAAVTQQP